MVLPFGLRNSVATVSHLVAQSTIPSSVNNEFMGMIESVTESLHGLLAEGPGSDSGSNSSRGSHHPSCECFMVGTPEGCVESIHEGGLPHQMTSMTRSRKMQGPRLAYEWSS